MSETDFNDIVSRSLELRKKYHQLELQHHGSEWTVEEDALAYLTDAGLVGRNIMSQQERWPKANSQSELEHKLGENIWWLIVLADRSGIDIKEAVGNFLTKTEGQLS
ncbi:nucleoside triphosphate pyrophosphohydrolase family protein [Filimonas effusa]|uniref:MazG-like protein n=1 Tax=Filimonas effusa TaxID=2508721 RepID=A0A4Q1D5R8_9BACT|nr:MazG-like protein [Filimonas effusa]RXK83203.1 MazG-like protein [Filimonas effusa]